MPLSIGGEPKALIFVKMGEVNQALELLKNARIEADHGQTYGGEDWEIKVCASDFALAVQALLDGHIIPTRTREV